jgi:ABC-type glycerol-3-phosphate transport system permease component
MTKKRVSIAFKVSVTYFLCVIGLFLGYEASLKSSEHGGFVPGILLALITMPGVNYGGSIAAFFHCKSASICEHFSGFVIPGCFNTVVIYFLARGVFNAWDERK